MTNNISLRRGNSLTSEPNTIRTALCETARLITTIVRRVVCAQPDLAHVRREKRAKIGLVRELHCASGAFMRSGTVVANERDGSEARAFAANPTSGEWERKNGYVSYVSAFTSIG